MSDEEKESRDLIFIPKKLKRLFNRKNEQSKKMDPFDQLNLPYEVIEEIIGYLPLKDRLNACLVSKLWNTTIGNSSTFKKNTILSIHTWDSSERFLEFCQKIPKSDRSYEIIEIRAQKLDSRFYKAFEGLKKNHCKNVTINGINKVVTLMNALSAFPFVKNLRIMDAHNHDYRERTKKSESVLDHPQITFEFLESLVISDMDTDIFKQFVRSYPKLKTVSLRCLSSNSEPILKFLQENQSIENLQIDSKLVQEVFKFDLSNVLQDFKLKSLIVGLDGVEHTNNQEVNIGVRRGWRRHSSESDYDESFEDYSDNSDDEFDDEIDLENFPKPENTDIVKNMENLQKFLGLQGNYLEHLKLILNHEQRNVSRWSSWANNEDRRISTMNLNILFKSWTFMTVLKALTIRLMKNVDERAEDILAMRNLNKNSNLSFLGFQFINVTPPLQTIMGFLKICPNLVEIYVTILNESILNFCTLNLRNLKLIKCYKFEGDCLKFYEELKNSKTKLNNHIKIEDGHVLG